MYIKVYSYHQMIDNDEAKANTWKIMVITLC